MYIALFLRDRPADQFEGTWHLPFISPNTRIMTPPLPPPTHTQMQSSDDERPTLQELMEQVVMQLVKHLSSTVSHLLSQQNVPPLTSLIPSPPPQLSSLTVRIKRRGLVKIIMWCMPLSTSHMPVSKFHSLIPRQTISWERDWNYYAAAVTILINSA